MFELVGLYKCFLPGLSGCLWSVFIFTLHFSFLIMPLLFFFFKNIPFSVFLDIFIMVVSFLTAERKESLKTEQRPLSGDVSVHGWLLELQRPFRVQHVTSTLEASRECCSFIQNVYFIHVKQQFENRLVWLSKKLGSSGKQLACICDKIHFLALLKLT